MNQGQEHRRRLRLRPFAGALSALAQLQKGRRHAHPGLDR